MERTVSVKSTSSTPVPSWLTCDLSDYYQDLLVAEEFFYRLVDGLYDELCGGSPRSNSGNEEESEGMQLLRQSNCIQDIYKYFKMFEAYKCCTVLVGGMDMSSYSIRIASADSESPDENSDSPGGLLLTFTRGQHAPLTTPEMRSYKKSMLCAKYPILTDLDFTALHSGSASVSPKPVTDNPEQGTSSADKDGNMQENVAGLAKQQNLAKERVQKETDKVNDKPGQHGKKVMSQRERVAQLKESGRRAGVEEYSLVSADVLQETVNWAYGIPSEEVAIFYRIVFNKKEMKNEDEVVAEDLVYQLSLLETGVHPIYNKMAFVSQKGHTEWIKTTRDRVVDMLSKFWKDRPFPNLKSKEVFSASDILEDFEILLRKLYSYEDFLMECRREKRQVLRLSPMSQRCLSEFSLRYGVGANHQKTCILRYLVGRYQFTREYLAEVLIHIIDIIDSNTPINKLLKTERTSLRICSVILLDNCKVYLVNFHSRYKEPQRDPECTVGETDEVEDDRRIMLEYLANLIAGVVELFNFVNTDLSSLMLVNVLNSYCTEHFHLIYQEYSQQIAERLGIQQTEQQSDSNSPQRGQKKQLPSQIKQEEQARENKILQQSRKINCLISSLRSEVHHCSYVYGPAFKNYLTDVTSLAAQVFYSRLVTEVNVIVTSFHAFTNRIDFSLVALLYRLNTLDQDWSDYLNLNGRKTWRIFYCARLNSWWLVLQKESKDLLLKSISLDKFNYLEVMPCRTTTADYQSRYCSPKNIYMATQEQRTASGTNELTASLTRSLNSAFNEVEPRRLSCTMDASRGCTVSGAATDVRYTPMSATTNLRTLLESSSSDVDAVAMTVMADIHATLSSSIGGTTDTTRSSSTGGTADTTRRVAAVTSEPEESGSESNRGTPIGVQVDCVDVSQTIKEGEALLKEECSGEILSNNSTPVAAFNPDDIAFIDDTINDENFEDAEEGESVLELSANVRGGSSAADREINNLSVGRESMTTDQESTRSFSMAASEMAQAYDDDGSKETSRHSTATDIGCESTQSSSASSEASTVISSEIKTGVGQRVEDIASVSGGIDVSSKTTKVTGETSVALASFDEGHDDSTMCVQRRVENLSPGTLSKENFVRSLQGSVTPLEAAEVGKNASAGSRKESRQEANESWAASEVRESSSEPSRSDSAACVTTDDMRENDAVSNQDGRNEKFSRSGRPSNQLGDGPGNEGRSIEEQNDKNIQETKGPVKVMVTRSLVDLISLMQRVVHVSDLLITVLYPEYNPSSVCPEQTEGVDTCVGDSETIVASDLVESAVAGDNLSSSSSVNSVADNALCTAGTVPAVDSSLLHATAEASTSSALLVSNPAATTGGVDATAGTGGVDATATTGGVDATATTGGVDATATTGGVDATATTGGVDATAATGAPADAGATAAAVESSNPVAVTAVSSPRDTDACLSSRTSSIASRPSSISSMLESSPGVTTSKSRNTARSESDTAAISPSHSTASHSRDTLTVVTDHVSTQLSSCSDVSSGSPINSYVAYFEAGFKPISYDDNFFRSFLSPELADQRGNTLSSLRCQVKKLLGGLVLIYVKNMLFMDICGLKDEVIKGLAGSEEVMEEITVDRQRPPLVWGCRHKISNTSCYKYNNQKSVFIGQQFEPITSDMCVRISALAELETISRNMFEQLRESRKFKDHRDVTGRSHDADKNVTTDGRENVSGGRHPARVEKSHKSELHRSQSGMSSSTLDGRSAECFSQDIEGQGQGGREGRSVPPRSTVRENTRERKSSLGSDPAYDNWLLQYISASHVTLINILAYRINLFTEAALKRLLDPDLSGRGKLQSGLRHVVQFLTGRLRLLESTLKQSDYLDVVGRLWDNIVKDLETLVRGQTKVRVEQMSDRSEDIREMIATLLGFFCKKYQELIIDDTFSNEIADAAYWLQLYSLPTDSLVDICKIVLQHGDQGGRRDSIVNSPLHGRNAEGSVTSPVVDSNPSQYSARVKCMHLELHRRCKSFTGQVLLEWVHSNPRSGVGDELEEIDELLRNGILVQVDPVLTSRTPSDIYPPVVRCEARIVQESTEELQGLQAGSEVHTVAAVSVATEHNEAGRVGAGTAGGGGVTAEGGAEGGATTGSGDGGWATAGGEAEGGPTAGDGDGATAGGGDLGGAADPATVRTETDISTVSTTYTTDTCTTTTGTTDTTTTGTTDTTTTGTTDTTTTSTAEQMVASVDVGAASSVGSISTIPCQVDPSVVCQAEAVGTSSVADGAGVHIQGENTRASEVKRDDSEVVCERLGGEYLRSVSSDWIHTPTPGPGSTGCISDLMSSSTLAPSFCPSARYRLLNFDDGIQSTTLLPRQSSVERTRTELSARNTNYPTACTYRALARADPLSTTEDIPGDFPAASQGSSLNPSHRQSFSELSRGEYVTQESTVHGESTLRGSETAHRDIRLHHRVQTAAEYYMSRGLDAGLVLAPLAVKSYTLPKGNAAERYLRLLPTNIKRQFPFIRDAIKSSILDCVLS